MSARRPTRSAGTTSGIGDRVQRRQRRRERLEALRRLGQQRRQRVARERDLLVDGLDLLARLGPRALALAQLDGGVEAGADALPRQREDFFALRESALQNGALLDQARELRRRCARR